MGSIKKKARTAGLIYLVLVVFGVFSLLYVPTTYVVFGDATATASKLASSELLFRLGILGSLISQIVYAILALALYRVFKDVDRSQAVLMVTLVVIGASTAFVNEGSNIAALIVLSGADFLSVFDKAQLDAMAYMFLRLNGYVLQAIQIFWGLWLIPFGVLVYKSRFIPKILGALLFIAGFGYLLSSFVFFVLPQFKDTVSPFATALEMAELPIVLWLLIVGAKEQSREEPTPRAA